MRLCFASENCSNNIFFSFASEFESDYVLGRLHKRMKLKFSKVNWLMPCPLYVQENMDLCVLLFGPYICKETIFQSCVPCSFNLIWSLVSPGPLLDSQGWFHYACAPEFPSLAIRSFCTWETHQPCCLCWQMIAWMCVIGLCLWPINFKRCL